MSNMFKNSQFNNDISRWNVGNVTQATWMFKKSKFTGNVSGWNTLKVKHITDMFEDCPAPEENKPKRVEGDDDDIRYRPIVKIVGVLIVFYVLYLQF